MQCPSSDPFCSVRHERDGDDEVREQQHRVDDLERGLLLMQVSGNSCVGGFVQPDTSGTSAPPWIVGDTFVKNVCSVFQASPVILSTLASIGRERSSSGRIMAPGATLNVWPSKSERVAWNRQTDLCAPQQCSRTTSRHGCRVLKQRDAGASASDLEFATREQIVGVVYVRAAH